MEKPNELPYPFPDPPQPIPCAEPVSTQKDQLLMTEAERSIEAVRNSRLTLSVVQQIAALQRGEE